MPDPVTALVAGGAGLLSSNVSKNASDNATDAQVKSAEAQQDITKAGTEAARADLLKLYPSAEQSLMGGFQGALDSFAQTIPAQQQAFQQGNVGAQNALIAGLPQMNNALLGNQIDYSAFQPQTLQTDTTMFNQQLPTTNKGQAQYTTIQDALNPKPIVNSPVQGPLTTTGLGWLDGIDTGQFSRYIR